MSGWVLGIDLGTTNSVVAVADGGQVRVLADADGHRLIPSVVSFHPSAGVLIGDIARERRLMDARNTVYSVKRLIGRPYASPEVDTARKRFAFDLTEGRGGVVMVKVRKGIFTLPEISAFVLREVRRVAEAALGEPCTRAVITVPASFDELQRSATKAAGRVAGLEVLRILNEPTAAALAYGCGRDQPERVAVYDLGGGTFDLSVLELDGEVVEVVSTSGDSFLGGDDIDVLIAEAMADTFLRAHRWDAREDVQAFERLRSAAEWAKCQLSSLETVQVTVPELAYGDGGSALDLVFRMTRSELEARIRPLLARSFDVCAEAMRDAAIEPGDVDAVVLVGGSTRIPLVRRMVRDFFGKEPRSEIDPDLVVAQGAAIQAHALSGAESTPKPLGKLSPAKRTKTEAAADKQRRDEALVGRPEQVAFAPARPAPLARSPKVRPPRASTAPPSLPNLPAPTVPPLSFLVPLVLERPPSSRPPPEEGAWGPSSIPPPGEAPRSEPPEELDSSDVMSVEDLGGSLVRAEPALEDSVVIDGAYAASLEPGRLLRYVSDDMDPSIEIDGLEPPPDDEASVDRLGAPPTGSPEPAAPPPGRAQPVLALAAKPVPLLMDVTPRTLAIETAGGYCRAIVRRNAPIPAEQTRRFTTAQDGQTAVHVRICQGEGPRFGENQPLGEIVLDGLPSRSRGDVSIDVAFLVDANGTLDVRAIDVATGRAQAIRIKLQGGLSDDEIAQMAARQRDVLGESA